MAIQPSNLAPLPTEQSGSSPSPAIQSCRLCWIEIQVLDEDDQPFTGELYWIRLTDGSVREGRLPDTGLVRFDNIPCGTCIVKLPKYEGAEIVAHAQKEPEKTDWIEIVLLDEQADPVPNVKYTIELPGGSKIRGALDKNGYGLHQDIPHGRCKVTFEDIDEAEFLKEAYQET